MTPRRVRIVEDYEDIALLVRMTLEAAGIATATTSSDFSTLFDPAAWTDITTALVDINLGGAAVPTDLLVHSSPEAEEFAALAGRLHVPPPTGGDPPALPARRITGFDVLDYLAECHPTILRVAITASLSAAAAAFAHAEHVVTKPFGTAHLIELIQ